MEKIQEKIELMEEKMEKILAMEGKVDTMEENPPKEDYSQEIMRHRVELWKLGHEQLSYYQIDAVPDLPVEKEKDEGVAKEKVNTKRKSTSESKKKKAKESISSLEPPVEAKEDEVKKEIYGEGKNERSAPMESLTKRFPTAKQLLSPDYESVSVVCLRVRCAQAT